MTLVEENNIFIRHPKQYLSSQGKQSRYRYLYAVLSLLGRVILFVGFYYLWQYFFWQNPRYVVQDIIFNKPSYISSKKVAYLTANLIGVNSVSSLLNNSQKNSVRLLSSYSAITKASIEYRNLQQLVVNIQAVQPVAYLRQSRQYLDSKGNLINGSLFTKDLQHKLTQIKINVADFFKVNYSKKKAGLLTEVAALLSKIKQYGEGLSDNQRLIPSCLIISNRYQVKVVFQQQITALFKLYQFSNQIETLYQIYRQNPRLSFVDLRPKINQPFYLTP